MLAHTIDEKHLTALRSLTTARLQLVPLGPEHLDQVWQDLHDPENLRLTGTRGTFERDAVQAHLGSVGARADRADWAVVLRDGEDYVGEVVLNELDHDNASMNFRIALVPGHLGRGYGTEAARAVLDHAFDTMGLHRVYLDVFSFNPRAARSYEKVGFQVEGRQRHTLCWDGEWVDSILMSVLDSDARPAL